MNIGAIVCMQVATQNAIRAMQNSRKRQKEREEQHNTEVSRSPRFERVIDEYAESMKGEKE